MYNKCLKLRLIQCELEARKMLIAQFAYFAAYFPLSLSRLIVFNLNLLVVLFFFCLNVESKHEFLIKIVAIMIFARMNAATNLIFELNCCDINCGTRIKSFSMDGLCFAEIIFGI